MGARWAELRAADQKDPRAAATAGSHPLGQGWDPARAAPEAAAGAVAHARGVLAAIEKTYLVAVTAMAAVAALATVLDKE